MIPVDNAEVEPFLSTSKTIKRICVGCGAEKPRHELLRLTVDHKSSEVRLNNDSLKLHGRSAYLCASAECFTKAQKGARLRNALVGRRKKKGAAIESGERTVAWPLEAQLIKVISQLCADQGKTCQNTQR